MSAESLNLSEEPKAYWEGIGEFGDLPDLNTASLEELDAYKNNILTALMGAKYSRFGHGDLANPEIFGIGVYDFLKVINTLIKKKSEKKLETPKDTPPTNEQADK